MTQSRDPDRLIRAFFAEGRSDLPDLVYDVVRTEIGQTRQRVVVGPWRIPDINTYAKLAIGVAAVVVVAVVGTNLLQGATPVGGPTASPSPSASAAPTPPSSASIARPSPSPVAPSATGDGPPVPGALAPGRYEQTVGSTRVTYEVEGTMSVWAVARARAFDESLGIWEPDRVGINACDIEASRPVGPAVADLAEAIKGLPGVRVTEPLTTTVGGRPATYLEVAVDPACGRIGDCGGSRCMTFGYLWGREGDRYPTQGGLQLGIVSDARILLWIVDVDGARIVIEGDLVPSEGPGFEEAARRLVDSITFESPRSDPSAAAKPTTLGASEVGQTLPRGTYRVARPFGKPFTIALLSDWKVEGLSRTTASFVDARAETAGAIGIEVALAGSVYADPCHPGRPMEGPVPSTVEGMVEALTNVVGFTLLPVSDTHIGDRAAKAFVLERDFSRIPDGADCAIARDQIWVVDVDGAPVVIRGTSYHRIAAGGLMLNDAIESISFD
jgi:hypothetical protein